jgi:type II secretory pathway component GspD/PulD (secretin)
VVTAQNNKIPIIDTSTAETTVMIKDGSTVAIGGLRREENTEDSSEVPILGKIPVVGNLLKSGTDKSVRSELLILVTPHIIEGDELKTGSTIENQNYQKYQPITTESDLTAYKGRVTEKNYRDYPDLNTEEQYSPGIKPLRDE